MTVVALAEIVERFPVGRSVIEVRATGGRPGFPTWRLTTDEGTYFVKRLGHRDDRTADGMRFELAAHRAGIPMPAPVLPFDTAMVTAAPVGDLGPVTVHEWVEAATGPAPDLSGWLGGVLAAVHRIRPVETATPAPLWYGTADRDRWTVWLERGRRAGRPWAGPLAERLPLLWGVMDDVEAAFARFGPYAVSHPDVEPWNVVVTAEGPLLVDWDQSGPDSAPLVLAHGALNFAMAGGRPDPERIVRTVRAYRAAGGPALPPGPGLLARRMGLMLGRLTDRLTADTDPAPGHDPAVGETAAERLHRLPEFTAALSRWERLFPRD
ncbi:Ser/Thr protein kinase RdoA (MazF antagonist) [Stackebrandtia albiflava]|uniref:Ser/Thr protein kinase RdoA (MazF antagonist) n=1 Tax=Stackebrandtia albiflava TaxID=406432 RepID=A0A562VCA8_9ACTN|nr:aminoglycoside phosphotransferase family protein [Stackebrandtia albiflava]TWJ15514.1 Ser/Thr protein kinase RdoA (MazF antagonist) [Stackebrandtia albiflava]